MTDKVDKMNVSKILKIILTLFATILLASCFSVESGDTVFGSETESNQFTSSDEFPFSGNNLEAFASSIKEIYSRPDEFGIYAAAKEKILSGEAFIFLPQDCENITYLGASIHSPCANSILTNNDGMAEAVEICTVCRFICHGKEYSIGFDSYNFGIPNSVETYTIIGNEVTFVIYKDIKGYKHANCCIFKLDETSVTLSCPDDYLFEDISFESYEDLIELANLFNLKKINLSDFLCS